MTGADLSDEALFAFLRSHPDVRNRVASIALTVENSEGDLKEADAAEERLLEEDAAFGTRSAAGLGGEAGGGDGERNSSATSDASPR